MDPFLIIGLVALFGGMFAARIITERAQSALSREEKLALLDGFAKHRTYASLPLIALVFGFFGLRLVPYYAVLPCFFLLALLFGGYMAWQGRAVHRRLRELGIAGPFVSAIRKAQWCSRAGWFIFFLVMTRALMDWG